MVILLIAATIYLKLYQGPSLAYIAQCKHYSTCHFVHILFGDSSSSISSYSCAPWKTKLHFTAVQVVQVIQTNY